MSLMTVHSVSLSCEDNGMLMVQLMTDLKADNMCSKTAGITTSVRQAFFSAKAKFCLMSADD